jgi:flagellar hook-length control protein FliK
VDAVNGSVGVTQKTQASAQDEDIPADQAVQLIAASHGNKPDSNPALPELLAALSTGLQGTLEETSLAATPFIERPQAIDTTLQGLLLNEQRASHHSPVSLLLESRPLLNGKLSEQPDLQLNPQRSAWQVQSRLVHSPGWEGEEGSGNPVGAADNKADIRMQVRTAVLGLANRSGSTLPPGDQILPLSAAQAADASALNALLSANSTMQGATPGQPAAGIETMSSTTLTTVEGEATRSPYVMREQNPRVVPGYSTEQNSENDLAPWQRHVPLANSGSTEMNGGTVISRTGIDAPAGSTISSGQISDPSMTAGRIDVMEPMLEVDGEASESRSDRSVFASASSVRQSTIGGQGQAGIHSSVSGAPAQPMLNAQAGLASTGILQIDQPAMQARLGQQIMMMHEKGVSSARIRLDPPELGSLLIKLEVKDQSAVVHFTAQNHLVRDNLEQQMPRLQQMMDDMGLELSDASVESQLGGQDGSSQEGSAESDRKQAGVMGADTDAIETRDAGNARVGDLSLVDHYV